MNKAYDRTGALFQRPFGRIRITSDSHLVWLVTYIHQNPQKHGFVDDFRVWPYSSYRALLTTRPTRVKRDDVLEWFGGREAFQSTHQQETDERKIASLTLADFD